MVYPSKLAGAVLAANFLKSGSVTQISFRVSLIAASLDWRPSSYI